jgi:glycosyltransferase involved in cell wall biosynthesis
MRLVLVGPVYPYRGGIAHYTAMLYRELKKRGHDVLLVSFSRQYPQWLFPGRSDRDPSREPLRVEEAQYWIDSLNPITWLVTAQRIRRYRPEAVILKWWVPYWGLPFGVISRLSHWAHTRVVYLCHNIVPHESSPFDRALTKLALSSGDEFLVFSRRSEQLLRDMYVESRIVRTDLPVHDALASTKVPKDEARQKLGLAMDEPVLLFFGLVRPYKGLNYLLDALPNVNLDAIPRLLIVGEFWEDREPYLNQIEALGLGERVTITDRYVPDEEVGVYFSACDVVVLPYVDTSQSAVVQLALGMGTPVITADVTGVPAGSRSSTGCLVVPPRDSQALADAIHLFFTDPAYRNRGGATTSALAHSTWEHLVDSVERLCSADAL